MIPLVAWQICQNIPVLMRQSPVSNDFRSVDSAKGKAVTSSDHLAGAFEKYLHIIHVALAGAEVVDFTSVHFAEYLFYRTLKSSMRTDL